MRYRDFLLSHSDDPREDLYGHATDELTMYLYGRLDRILGEVWGDMPTVQHRYPEKP